METSRDLDPRTGLLGWTTVAALAGNDPVAMSGDVARKFSLPPGDLVPLLVAPDMSLHGSTFEGMGPWEQWFGSMVIFSAQRDRWLQISIRKDILSFNATSNGRSAFQTLDVVIGHGDIGSALPGVSSFLVPNRDFNVPLGFLGLRVVFRAISSGSVLSRTIGRAQRECADVMGESLHFFICSAPAMEYFGGQRQLAIQFAHLDVAVLEITNAIDIDGLLPQLWGVKPLSDDNAKYLDDAPTSAMPANVSANELPETAGWVGSGTPEDLQMMVMERKDEPVRLDVASALSQRFPI